MNPNNELLITNITILLFNIYVEPNSGIEGTFSLKAIFIIYLTGNYSNVKPLCFLAILSSIPKGKDRSSFIYF